MMKSADIARWSDCYPFSSIFSGRGGAKMDITEIFNYLTDLLHDPIKGALTIVITAYADKLADKIKSKSNKRTVPNAGQQEDDSQQK